MHKRVNALSQFIMRHLPPRPFWQQWQVHWAILTCIVVIWGVVAGRIAQPQPHTLVLPDSRDSVGVPFVESFTVPFRWVRLHERILPTVITHLPANMRIALATHLFPHTEYVVYRGTLSVPYTNAPLIASMTWNHQQSTIARVSIPVQPTRIFQFLAPLESAHDVTLTYAIADVRAQMRPSAVAIADEDLGVALTTFTSTPVVVSWWITLLVVALQGILTVVLCQVFFRWCSLRPVSLLRSSAFGLGLITVVSIYEFVSGLPQTGTVWWVLLIALALSRLFPYIDVPNRFPAWALFGGIPLVVGVTLAWYAPYASNGCFRTITPPPCSLTQLDYWVYPWQSLLQLPALVFPPIAGVRYSNIAPLPGEVQPVMAVVVFVLTSLMVKAIRGWRLPLPVPLIITIAGASFITMGLPGMFPGILWMNVLEPTAYGTWATWYAGVTSMRIPVSPLTLAVEGWLIHSAFGFGMYKWVFFRMMLIGVLVLALFHHAQTRLYWWLAALGMSILICYSTYYTQMFAANHIAYLVFNNDIILVFALIVLSTLLRRPNLHGRHVFAIGSLLAIADMTRPYMVVFTPLLVILVCGYLWTRVPKQWLLLLCIPLIPIVLWHSNHVVNLHQPTWSNHAGYNLCNAWTCPNNVPLEPESPRTSFYRGTNFNTAVHSQNSQTLTRALIESNLHDPVRALIRGSKLILYSMSMPAPHATSVSNMRYPDIVASYPEWHAWSADAWLDIVLADVWWPPHQPVTLLARIGNTGLRILFGALFALQAVYAWRLVRHLSQQVRQRPTRPMPRRLLWHGIYASVLLGMYGVSNLSEFGENYRWVTMMGMAALYLPYAHLRAMLPQHFGWARKTLWG